MQKALVVVAALFTSLVLYFALWPVPIDPEVWQPPQFDPDRWQPTDNFTAAVRVAVADTHGPEDIDVDDSGRIYGGFADGRILRWDTPEAEPETFVNTGGRPLGLDWDGTASALLVADAMVGLLSVDQNGTVTKLADHCGGRPLVFTDDLELAADGAIWFSDASERFDEPQWELDFLENRPNGRLCVWRPGDDQAQEILGDLYFANGVAIDPGQQYVLVNETTRYRVRRYWIAGDRKGENEVIVDNLPGFPDGISTGSDGRFWVALASPRNSMLDFAGPRPWVRKAIHRLPGFLQPAPLETARALAITGDGQVLHDLWDPNGSKIWMVTSVQERNDQLYFGSLTDDGWATMPISSLSPSAQR